MEEITNHTCRLHCAESVPGEEQKDLHKAFWQLGSWDIQNQYIAGIVHVSDVKKHVKGAIVHKGKSRKFTLGTKQVCKAFFLKVLGVSQGRMQKAVEGASRNEGAAKKDGRGSGSKNKTPLEKIGRVMNHIEKFPKYESHYSRQQNQKRLYLAHNLSLIKLYHLYVSECKNDGVMPVSLNIYREVFNTKFRLSFRRPYTDTCFRCDTFQQKIKHGNVEERANGEREKELHQR